MKIDKQLEQDVKSLGDQLDKLDRLGETHKPQSMIKTAPKGMAQGIRLSVDFIAAIGVAGFMGWMLDGWLDTRPWLMVALLPIGFAAGILNMIRTAKKAELDQHASKNP
ncbi:MAG: AtpZ/AtpI family protein [Alphaproteobacteria bacterium]